MPKFLNATQARGEIESILTKAKGTIYVISPWIKVNEEFITRLTDAGEARHLKIVIVCREDDLRGKERAKVLQIPNLELRFNERVHAKCYYNEESMVIASLNLYESRDGDNHEMGILLSKFADEDRTAFRDAIAEAEFIIRESVPAPEQTQPANPQPSVVKSGSRAYRAAPSHGFCIRCGKPIDLNPQAPYCPDCYRVWAKYKKSDFEEDFCHACGKPALSSMEKPLCLPCYRSAA